MIHLTPPANFSFAGGVSATEVVAAEAGARAGAAKTFTEPELIDAVTELFKANDRARIVSMLPETLFLRSRKRSPTAAHFRDRRSSTASSSASMTTTTTGPRSTPNSPSTTSLTPAPTSWRRSGLQRGPSRRARP